MRPNEGIRAKDVKACLLCGEGGRTLYRGLRDRLFDAPGVWDYLRCLRCRLVWISPRPISEDLNRLYATYYTHATEDDTTRARAARRKVKMALFASNRGYSSLADGWAWRGLGTILRLLPPLKEMARLGIMCLDRDTRGGLLDVGCGSGQFLAIMRDAGWQVLGVEPDAEAAQLAQQRFGLRVIVGTLAAAALSDESFDVITLNHVIEHADDPLALLRECHRVLKAGGTLVVLTPNIESLGHRIFRQSWLHLDPPRHLHLFSLDTLEASTARAGFQTTIIRTSARSAFWTWNASEAIRNNKALRASSLPWWRVKGFIFHIGEEALRIVREDVGEELLLIATRRSDN